MIACTTVKIDLFMIIYRVIHPMEVNVTNFLEILHTASMFSMLGENIRSKIKFKIFL